MQVCASCRAGVPDHFVLLATTMCVSFIIHWHVQSVLSNDVMEFLPYVFQILAQLLELRPAPAPGTSNLTPGYESLFPPLLTATLWLRVGNVPALTQLMQVSLMLVVRFHRCMCTSRQQMAVFLHTVTPQHMNGFWSNTHFEFVTCVVDSYVQAYLRRGAAFIASSNNMGPLLGVWQQLLATPNQEEHAFALMEALCEYWLTDARTSCSAAVWNGC